MDLEAKDLRIGELEAELSLNRIQSASPSKSDNFFGYPKIDDNEPNEPV